MGNVGSPMSAIDSHILLLIGLTILIGPKQTLAFFARKHKIKGTAAFCLGLVIILLRWAFVGLCVELYGIFILFGDFINTSVGFLRNVPVVGPIVGAVAHKLKGEGREQSLSV
ncbi:Vesicle transport protein GOT1A [Golovinomyces cichoracearum]|uniref:Vesicle transport protein GOT1A n=1 Tax=Golovinomyces cichoracearum TaxID=62708 RepID=A0A420IXZ6_9PEZI|nr:Vesicle transport protein GOT1A [Golovinomyces cichoracearum]